MLIAGNDYTFEVQIKSPMGWVKVNASFHILSETAFTGQAASCPSTPRITARISMKITAIWTV